MFVLKRKILEFHSSFQAKKLCFFVVVAMQRVSATSQKLNNSLE
jgi:hypothetical protein